jgi:hypothetical protein
MNRALEEIDRSRWGAEERHPAVYVFGVPRSGTTVATQLLVAHSSMAYVNHVIAAHWRAPIHGILLNNRLFGGFRCTDLQSVHGLTGGAFEPHEFGRFWDRLFPSHDREVRVRTHSVDWDAVRGSLLGMMDAFARPAFFKSFHVGWHLPAFADRFRKAVFVWVRRDTEDTAASLLTMREEQTGSRDEWVSFRPPDHERYSELDCYAQVAGQALGLRRVLENNVSALEGPSPILVEYEDLCRNPAAYLEQVTGAVCDLGGDAKVVDGPPRALSPGVGIEGLDKRDGARLREAVERVGESL